MGIRAIKFHSRFQCSRWYVSVCLSVVSLRLHVQQSSFSFRLGRHQATLWCFFFQRKDFFPSYVLVCFGSDSSSSTPSFFELNLSQLNNHPFWLLLFHRNYVLTQGRNEREETQPTLALWKAAVLHHWIVDTKGWIRQPQVSIKQLHSFFLSLSLPPSAVQRKASEHRGGTRQYYRQL